MTIFIGTDANRNFFFQDRNGTDHPVTPPNSNADSDRHRNEHQWADQMRQDEYLRHHHKKGEDGEAIHFFTNGFQGHGSNPFSPNRLSPLPFPASHSSPDLCGLRL